MMDTSANVMDYGPLNELAELDCLEGDAFEDLPDTSAPSKKKNGPNYQTVSSITFDWLIKQQKINGEFNLDINSPVFAEFKPVKALEALQAIKGLNNVSGVCATLLGIVIFTAKFPAQEGQWIMMKRKSEKFLKRQMKNVSESITDLLNLFEF